jgi:hypothetical protein
MFAGQTLASQRDNPAASAAAVCLGLAAGRDERSIMPARP